MITVDGVIIDADTFDILEEVKMVSKGGRLNRLKQTDSGIKVPCPYHSNGTETHESCYVSEDGVFHCFTCNISGGLSKFISLCTGWGIERSKNWLKDNYGNGKVSQFLEPIILQKETKKVIPTNYNTDGLESWHPYMDKRRLDRKVCEDFQVMYDRKSDSIVFPVWDEFGNYIMTTRRSVSSKSFLIEQGKTKPLYLLDKVIKNGYNRCIITEGQIDALTSWGYGMPCVATFGGIAKSQIDILNKSGINIFITMFDNDTAGKKFTEKFNSGISDDKFVFNANINIKGKKDINDLTKEEFYKILKECGLNGND